MTGMSDTLLTANARLGNASREVLIAYSAIGDPEILQQKMRRLAEELAEADGVGQRLGIYRKGVATVQWREVGR
jgi:hypothetical protein